MAIVECRARLNPADPCRADGAVRSCGSCPSRAQAFGEPLLESWAVPVRVPIGLPFRRRPHQPHRVQSRTHCRPPDSGCDSPDEASRSDGCRRMRRQWMQPGLRPPLLDRPLPLRLSMQPKRPCEDSQCVFRWLRRYARPRWPRAALHPRVISPRTPAAPALRNRQPSVRSGAGLRWSEGVSRGCDPLLLELSRKKSSAAGWILPQRRRRQAYWFCEPRCAHPVVCFSTTLKSSYISIAMAPTTISPAKARPICMAEPAEISR